jgi:hypothetical protein
MDNARSKDSLCELIQYDILFMGRRENIVSALSKMLVDQIDIESNMKFLLYNIDRQRDIQDTYTNEMRIKYAIYTNLLQDRKAQEKVIFYLIHTDFYKELIINRNYIFAPFLQSILYEYDKSKTIINYILKNKNCPKSDFFQTILDNRNIIIYNYY